MDSRNDTPGNDKSEFVLSLTASTLSDYVRAMPLPMRDNNNGSNIFDVLKASAVFCAAVTVVVVIRALLRH